jgi:hypothetical protein
MKASISFCFLSAVFVTFSLTVLTSSSVIEKRDLISPSNGIALQSQNPFGWFMSGSAPDQYRASVDTTTAQHGKKSIMIESAVSAPEGFSTLMQSCIRKDFNGKRIRMTGYIKTKDAKSASMWIRVDDLDKKITADFDNMMDRPVSGTNDWTKCEIVFDVPSKWSLSYGFILEGSGRIWVDNVSFEIVDDSVSKTAQNLGSEFPEEMLAAISKLPDVLPDRPAVNLDFEED